MSLSRRSLFQACGALLGLLGLPKARERLFPSRERLYFNTWNESPGRLWRTGEWRGTTAWHMSRVGDPLDWEEMPSAIEGR